MRSLFVVGASPSGQHDTGMSQGAEQDIVEDLVPHATVEAFDHVQAAKPHLPGVEARIIHAVLAA